MERGLVGDRTAEDRGSVALVADGQTVEPGCPARVEVPGEPDLVASDLGAIGCRGVSFARSAPLACCRLGLGPTMPA